MTFVFIIILLIIGAIAAADFVENKIPQSKTGLDFVKPHAPWVGLVSLALGFYWIIKILFYLGIMLKYKFVMTLIIIASSLLLIILGFLLAQPLIMQLVGKNKNVSDVTDKMKKKFSPLTEKLGLASIAAGLLNLLLAIT
jgi:hypothetical protein